MKIRRTHPILDRVKVILTLLCTLVVLWNLAQYMDERAGFKKTATIQTLLQTAMQPVGSTMYVWGGGWDSEDKASGATSTQIGLYPQWTVFAAQQDSTYDFNNHRLERENGLDCSGYVGWVIYNTFESESGKDGYVINSTEMAKNYAERGWGEWIENPSEFLAGDIVSMDGHVWICLGTCTDGSVLLAHSSPPGVSVCGTTLEDGTESIAVKLATEYMTKHHLKWQENYPNRMVATTYKKNVTLMRWNSMTMRDAKELQNKSGEEILHIISPDM